MKTYRYRLTAQADFQKLLEFLLKHKINFETQYLYIQSAGEHRYVVNVSSCEEEYSKDIPGHIAALFDKHIGEVDYHEVNYDEDVDVLNDPYSDTLSLKVALKNKFDELKKVSESSEITIADLRKMNAEYKEDIKFYHDKSIHGDMALSRVKTLVQALATLAASIFPDEQSIIRQHTK